METVTLEDLLIYNYLIAIILLMLKDLRGDQYYITCKMALRKSLLSQPFLSLKT